LLLRYTIVALFASFLNILARVEDLLTVAFITSSECQYDEDRLSAPAWDTELKMKSSKSGEDPSTPE
jgi:hypothetical protein